MYKYTISYQEAKLKNFLYNVKDNFLRFHKTIEISLKFQENDHLIYIIKIEKTSWFMM